MCSLQEDASRAGWFGPNEAVRSAGPSWNVLVLQVQPVQAAAARTEQKESNRTRTCSPK